MTSDRPGDRHRLRNAGVLACVVAVLIAATAGAKPHGLDVSLVQNVAGPPVVAVDSMGRIVVAFGSEGCDGVHYFDQGTCSSARLLIERYLANGQLDPTFANDGTAAVSLGKVVRVDADSVVIEPGNRIVVAATGSPQMNGEGSFGLLAALTSAGRPDVGFGDGGRRLIDGRITASFPGSGRSMAVTRDGGFVLTGSSYESRPRFAVARYSATGDLVPSFGDAGVVRNDFSVTQDTFGATALAVDRAGRILVGGSADNRFGVARLLGNGSLDTSFSDDGRLTIAAMPESFGYTVESDPTNVFELADGKLLLVGWENAGDHGGCPQTVSVRLGADGTPDSSYGDGGVDRKEGDCAWVAAALLGPGERLITAGGIWNYFSEGDYQYLLRGPDGSKAVGMLHDPGGGLVSDADLLRGGDVLVAGNVVSEKCAVGDTVDGAPCSAMALKRLHSDGSPEASFGDGGLVTYPAIQPALDPSRFRLLVAQSMPETVRIHKGSLTVRPHCVAEIRTSCRFALTLKTRRAGAIQLKPMTLAAGTAGRLEASVGNLDAGTHGNLRGEVSAPGQDPVDVHARVTIDP